MDPYLRELARRAAAGKRLRESDVRAPAELANAIDSVTSSFAQRAVWSEALDLMLKDFVLTKPEVDSCLAILEEIRKAIRSSRRSLPAGSPLELLEQIANLSGSLIDEKSVVADIETSAMGDRVHYVTTDLFFHLNEACFSDLLSGLDRLVEDADGNPDDDAAGLNTVIVEAARLCGWVEYSVPSGALHAETPKLASELRIRLDQIGHALETYQLARESETFEESIQSAHDAITSLVRERKRDDDPIKLMGWVKEKKEAKELKRLQRLLQGKDS